MSNRTTLLQSAASRIRGLTPRRSLAIVRVLSLIVLFLLPMQMRAGVSDPHPHAMLQLLLDARDGAIDHHADDGAAAAHDDHAELAAAPRPDVPTFGAANHADGSMALLAAFVLIFRLPGREISGFWPSSPRLTGRPPELDPPPPRVRGD